MMMNNSTPPSMDAGPRGILRVTEVLQLLATTGKGCSLADLSQMVELPKTSLRRLLLTLEQGKFVVFRNNGFSLGPSSFHLAALIAQSAGSESLSKSARPIMEWLSEQTEEGVMLAVLSEDESDVIYVDVIQSLAPLRLSIPLGNRRSLLSSASGKAILAFLSEDRRQELVATLPIEPLTQHTTRRQDLPEIIAQTRRDALSFDSGGVIDGASSVASPIFEADGSVRAAISIAGPSERIDWQRADLERVVRTAGEQISRICGFTGNYPPAPTR